MKKSIFTKTFGTILIAVLIILAAAYIMTSLFAENIYYSSKIVQAKETAEAVGRLVDEKNKSYSEFIYNVDELVIQIGGRIIILDKDNQMVYGSRANSDLNNVNEFVPTESTGLEAGEYKIYEYKNSAGNVIQYTYAERLENGVLVLVGIQVKSITETVAIIKRIMMFVMVAAAIIAVDAAYLLSRNISVPLRRLNYVAKEIGRLNFDVRYEGTREDEIGMLGGTLNELSEKLEKNIDGLRKELEKEKNMDILRRQFIAQASHEMQTPIAIINSYMEAIEDGFVEDEEERERYFEIIRDETNKMSKMVKSMLDLSQIESGTFTIKRAEFDIYGLLEPACEKFRILAESQDINFMHSEIPKNGFYVYGDEFRLEQVLTNFISNAYKHTMAGKMTYLSFREIEESEMVEPPISRYDRGIRISVWNEGEGINEADLPYIWESFYKAKTLTGQKGTGLGLSISRSILQLHGYAFGAENVGDGVEFWFEAPGRFEK